MIFFDKEYDDESLYDLGRDVYEAFDPEFNPAMPVLEKDEHGFTNGRYRVVIYLLEEEK